MSASLQIQTARGGSGSVNYVGDAWTIIITGAAANKPISSWGIQNGSSNSPNAVDTGHTTDSSGSAILTGTFDSSTIGTWTEEWFVDGTSIGSINFQVQAVPTVSTTAAASSSTASSGSFLSSTFMGLPLLAWGAIGVGAYFVFKPKGR